MEVREDTLYHYFDQLTVQVIIVILYPMDSSIKPRSNHTPALYLNGNGHPGSNTMANVSYLDNRHGTAFLGD